MENNRLGLIGSALLIAGLFAPTFTLGFGGTLNFISGNPVFVSLSILALGCMGIFARVQTRSEPEGDGGGEAYG